MMRTMTGYSAKSIDELPTLWEGFAKLARAGLEITAFGANIMDLPPDYSTKSHDESESGQQELYVALRGSGSVDIDGVGLPLDPDHLVRVDAGTARTHIGEFWTVLNLNSDGLVTPGPAKLQVGTRWIRVTWRGDRIRGPRRAFRGRGRLG